MQPLYTAAEVPSLRAEQMAGLSFPCGCGRTHAAPVKKCVVGTDIAPEIARTARAYPGKAFLVEDTNTHLVYGRQVEQAFERESLDFHAYVFQPQGVLVPDEQAVGRALIEMPADTAVIVAIGSGTINDLCRELSCKTHIPYLIAATAPSMDGFASVISPLIVDHFKVSVPAVYADAIFADLSVLREAPLEMIQAGYGDMVGKYNALTDWVLAREVNGEYYCETCVALVQNAMAECLLGADGLTGRDDASIRSLIEGLLLSGFAIGLVGNSRPASGAEHHLSHYWEIDALKHGRPHPLHGNAVGVGTVVTSSIYEMLKDELPKACAPKSPAFIAETLRRVGAHDNPKALGISRALFHESILHAKEVRPRYTILQFAADAGKLGHIADVLTERFYG